MPQQIEMSKCRVCETYFANRLITSNQCKDCLKVPIAKQEIAEQETKKENPSNNDSNQK